MGSVFSEKKPQEKEKMNENLPKTSQENINIDNNPLINSTIQENEKIQESQNNMNAENDLLFNSIIQENENFNNIIFDDNPIMKEKNIKENDSLMNKKRKRDNELNCLNLGCQFSFSQINNSQNIIEENEQNEQEKEKEKVLKDIEEEKKKLNELLSQCKNFYRKIKVEIDEKLVKGNKIKDKNVLKKSIRKIIETSIIQDKNKDKYETLYNSLKPDIRKSFREKFLKVEEMLNEETYIKSENKKNEYNNNENMNNTKPTDTVEPNENNTNSNEINSPKKK